jgi:hypothetical protein
MSFVEGSVITRASNEWCSRPDDERYLSLESLHEAVIGRTAVTQVRTIENVSLVARGAEEAGGTLRLEHADLGLLAPSHWSLNQLATVSHTPAKWIREIATAPAGPALAAAAINTGLRHLAAREEVQVMSLGTDPTWRELRCIVGPDYGRIYDHEVVEAVIGVNADERWKVPAASGISANPKRATTLYASDRDVFIFLVDEHHPVAIKIDGTTRYLFRGFMVWNSEVGHHKFGFMTFLYDYVCDNRMVWGAREVKGLTIKHTKNAPNRFAREAYPQLRDFANASVKDVEEQLARASRMKVANSDEDVLTWLRSHDFTKKEGESIVRMAKAEEGDARTLWQVVNGGTAFARSIPHADERVVFEKRVSGLLKAT